MTEQAKKDKMDALADLELADLAENSSMLTRDAKEMLLDLLDGVDHGKSTARILFGCAVVAFALVPLFVCGSVTAPGGLLSTGLGSLGVFMLGLGIAASLNGLKYRKRYSELEKKYSELYETAKNLK